MPDQTPSPSLQKSEQKSVPVHRSSPAPAASGARVSSVGPAVSNQSVQRVAQGCRALPPASGAAALVDQARLDPGSPLAPDVRDGMPSAFGDLSDIRVHTGRTAAEATHAVGARAFAMGRDLFFAANAYRPNWAEGRHLITHEVAHAVQQRGASAAASTSIGRDESAESDAEIAASSGVPPIVTTDAMRVMAYPESTSASDLVWSYYSSFSGFDSEGLGSRLYQLAWTSPDHYAFVIEALGVVPWGDRDDVASAFTRSAREENLDEFARTATGIDMLRRMKDELLGGITFPREGGDAVRLNNAIRRATGAQEGRVRADAALDAAVERARSAPPALEIPPLDPAEIGDRLRLIALILTRLRTRYQTDLDMESVIIDLESDVDWEQISPHTDPEGDAARVAVAQRIVERADRSLTQLDALLTAYGNASDIGAAQPHYLELAGRVRAAWVDALVAAFRLDAIEQLSIAEAESAALPRALTEIDLGMLASRQAGYSMIENGGVAMVEWVNWVRARLDALEQEAAELSEAHRRGDSGLEQREAEFRNEADLIQLSIEGIQHWERGLRAYEFLAGGTNLILGAYEDVATILERCQAMKDAAEAGDVERLRTLVQQHRDDPNVETFYEAMPLFVGASAMIAGIIILLVAAVASAGVGALAAVPEGASMAAVAGQVALETLTFTAVSRGLQGVVAPPSHVPFLLELALNFGLFMVLRITGSAIRSALQARGLTAFTGLATHSAAFGILQAFGLFHFRLEEGRWPTGDEIALMSAESLVMLAGITVATRGFSRAIAAGRRLSALETLHNRYGLRLATIEIARTRLAGRFQTELVAGRGDDAIMGETLRSEAEALERDMRQLVDEIRRDADIGIESLRTELSDRELARSDVAGDLLSTSLDLPRSTGLRRAGGEAQYTYAFGGTEPVAERLQAMGATVTQATGELGLHTVIAEMSGQPPMFFVERAQEFGTRLAEFAEIIGRTGATHAERTRVIDTLRTTHDAEPGELEGFVLDSSLAENQRAIADLATQLLGENPDVIVGMERGGAFLADAVSGGDPTLRGRVRRMPVHLNAKGEKFDGPAMVAEFERLMADDGARRFALVDTYMGGTTASALRDEVLLPLARRHPDVRVDVHWLRESLGFETRASGGGVTLAPRRGAIRPTQPGASQITADERTVRLAVGDDMTMVYDPNSREPITIFDSNGNITEVFYPRPGQSTRDLLIELLNRRPGP